ncbi:MAG: hypothetical protein V8Q71_02305 [Bacilli bacterium]
MVDNNPKSKPAPEVKHTDGKLYKCTSIGSDEVGTGDYFGPIVVTATYVTKIHSFFRVITSRDAKK